MTASNEFIASTSPNGNGRLLETWARDFRLPLIRFFQKRAPRTVEPDDLVQEVFMRLAKRADLDSIEHVDGYLFQTAASVLTDRFRRDGRKVDTVDLAQDEIHAVVELTPERVLMDKQDLAELVQALYDLPERTRHIFVLYHFENIRQSEIANHFNMPVSTVEKHMARANKALMMRLGRKK